MRATVENAAVGGTCFAYYRGVAKVVFISYATPDREAAEQVCAGLEADGLECWIAPRDVPAGEDYAATIAAAVAACPLLLLVFSGASAASEHVEREVHLAAGARAAILPLRLEPVEPQGAFKYLLANRQYLDAFPRLAPQLPALRAEARRLLAERGVRLARTMGQRTPFERVVAIAGAWAVVAAFTLVLVLVMQGYWFNFTPATRVPVDALRQPLPLVLLLSGPVLALCAQYWITRTARTVPSLDALFAVAQGRGARIRLAAALGACAALGAAIPAGPAAVRVQLLDGAIDQAGEAYTPARQPLSSSSYVGQTARHYTVEVHVGRFDATGPYILRIALAPYATEDGVEFGDIWIHRDLHVTSVTPVAEHEQSRVYIEVEVPGPAFTGPAAVAFTVRHYRDSEPTSRAAITASLRSQAVEHHHVEPVAIPLQ